MKQHKWHKEIKAWADGAEIECKHKTFNGANWEDVKDPMWFNDVEYRIKPQPKEPQYLYVYDDGEMTSLVKLKVLDSCYVGKIKLEVDDE